MIWKLLTMLIGILFIGKIGCSGQVKEEKPQIIISIAEYNDCEGKDAANITLLEKLRIAQDCHFRGIVNQDEQDHTKLVICNGNTKKIVSVKILARSSYDAGVNRQAELLYEALSGPLEGKYIYTKIIFLQTAYLKKCSSILGYSYVTSRSAVLLISDRLDANVLLSPNGGYEQFKKGSSTICRGKKFLV